MSRVQDDAKSQGSRKSGKLHSAIEKAQAIQQREQLRTMICDKFNKDFSKGNKNISKLIEEIVTDYFSKEKVTEDSLRVLKGNVAKAVEDYRRDNKSGTHRNTQKKVRLLAKISSSATMMKSVARLLPSAARRLLRGVRKLLLLRSDQWLPVRCGRRMLVLWHLSQYIRWMVTTRTNGLLW